MATFNDPSIRSSKSENNYHEAMPCYFHFRKDFLLVEVCCIFKIKIKRNFELKSGSSVFSHLRIFEHNLHLKKSFKQWNDIDEICNLKHKINFVFIFFDSEV